MMKIKKPRIAIISDLHLGVHTNSQEWHKIAKEWAIWFDSELKRQNIKDVIFCGDWYHNRSEISVNTLQVSADILEIFADYNIISIVGNHDAYFKHRTDVNSLSIHKNSKNMTVIDSCTTVNCFDRNITFCPWNTPMESIVQSDVIFGHFEIETFLMTAHKMCVEGLSVVELLKRSPLVFSGHFHTRAEKKMQSGDIVYVGNPFEMDYGDTDNAKGYYILDLDTMEYKFYENQISPKHKKISVSTFEDVKAISVNDISFSNNHLKIKVETDDINEYEKITQHIQMLQPRTIVIDRIASNKFTSNIDNITLEGIDIVKAISEFIEMHNYENSDELSKLALDFYNKCIV